MKNVQYLYLKFESFTQDQVMQMCNLQDENNTFLIIVAVTFIILIYCIFLDFKLRQCGWERCYLLACILRKVKLCL